MRIFITAIGQFTRQASSCQHALALHHLACFTRRCTCLRCQYYFLNDRLCILWVLFEIGHQHAAKRTVYHAHYFTIAQLGLCLTLELWFRNLYGYDRTQALAEI